MKHLSNGLVSVFSKFTIDQNGDHTTRVGIVTYATNVVTRHNLTDFSNTAELLQALSKLTSYCSFELLSTQNYKNMKRVPLIVLIGANYDHDGFQSLEEVAIRIKAAALTLWISVMRVQKVH
uniref:VWFA domain-containing protein n=1 Tax=Panagrolaimus sp. ES5 TaxID=591445 RepID=A0AC34G3I1_9BILA